MRPFFSICIPAFNAGLFLADTIESVLSQSFNDYELIIVDNASTDQTASLLSQYTDSRIRLFSNSQTLPAHQNWSRAVTLATGEWTKLLCADDLLKPDSLQKIHDDLKKYPELSVHAGRRDIIDESGKVVRSASIQFQGHSILKLTDVIEKVLRTGTNPLGESMCITWKTELTKQVGPFSDKWRYFIDLDYWLRLAQQSPLYYTSEVLGSFRVSSGSWTSSIGFRTTREAKEFIFSRSEFSATSRIVKFQALLRAASRTIARQIFSTIILRKNSRGRKSR